MVDQAAITMALMWAGAFALVSFSLLGIVLVGMKNTLASERRLAKEANQRLNLYSITRGRRR